MEVAVSVLLPLADEWFPLVRLSRTDRKWCGSREVAVFKVYVQRTTGTSDSSDGRSGCESGTRSNYRRETRCWDSTVVSLGGLFWDNSRIVLNTCLGTDEEKEKILCSALVLNRPHPRAPTSLRPGA